MPGRGFRSISIHKDIFEKLKEIADLKGMTAAQLVEYLVEQYYHPEKRALIDESESNGFARVEWRTWPGPYKDVVLDPNVDIYKSSAWIRTKDYITKAGSPQWTIENRVRNDPEFHVEKLFILSKKAWGANEVWDWIGNWLLLHFLRGENFLVFVAREDDVKEIDDQYYDMGIYGKDLVGYLKLSVQSDPRAYEWSIENIKGAKDNFEELKKRARILEKFEDFEKMRKQSYD